MPPVTNANDYDRSNYAYHENCTSRAFFNRLFKTKVIYNANSDKIVIFFGLLTLRRLISFYGNAHEDRKEKVGTYRVFLGNTLPNECN